jgi:predicted DNA-binding protein (MmcQ/YjbR family)
VDEAILLTVLRQVCLSLPEVRETVKWGHPTFEAGKKMFAVLDHYEGRPCIAFRAAPEKREALLPDERFFEAPYAARHGWVCLHADGPIDRTEVEELLRDSYRLVALKRMLSALNDPGKPQEPTEARPPKRLRGKDLASQGTK